MSHLVLNQKISLNQKITPLLISIPHNLSLISLFEFFFPTFIITLLLMTAVHFRSSSNTEGCHCWSGTKMDELEKKKKSGSLRKRFAPSFDLCLSSVGRWRSTSRSNLSESPYTWSPANTDEHSWNTENRGINVTFPLFLTFPKDHLWRYPTSLYPIYRYKWHENNISPISSNKIESIHYAWHSYLHSFFTKTSLTTNKKDCMGKLWQDVNKVADLLWL